MGNDDMPRKRQFDISMSRRTRRPSLVRVGDENVISRSSGEEESSEVECRRSLKELIMEEKSDGLLGTMINIKHDVPVHDLTSQIVVMKSDQETNNGVKLKKMVSRYAKVLGHYLLKKTPSVPSHKRPVLKLSL